MVSMTITYTGEKHCELTHGPSGTVVETDAPKDNMGRGERFSPTDLVGAALGSCILTTMGIVAEREGIQLDLRGTKAQVTKEMVDNPRRIGRLSVVIHMPPGVPKEHRRRMEAVAHACPVHKSLHPDVEAPIEIIYPD